MTLASDDVLFLNDSAVTIATAQATITAAIKERDGVIRAHIKDGTAGHTELAKQAGITRARIYQICASV